ncbi:hypothetical protein CKO23_00615 [Thiocystis violacea]|nr:hypothetical protein [Thiocystis violacea]
MHPLAELSDRLDPIRALLEAGGPVLWAIFALCLLLWTLIAERYLYRFRVYPRRLAAVEADWRGRPDRASWNARQIRRAIVSELALERSRTLTLIRALIAVCPLLGLLGTVTGMIQVFDVMAFAGSGNARAMADGVSLATIPTMAGMVVALSGLYFSTSLQRWAVFETERTADRLRIKG